MDCEQCQTGAERRWENKSKGTEDELKELNHSCDCCLRGLSTLSKQIRRCTRHPPLRPSTSKPSLHFSSAQCWFQVLAMKTLIKNFSVINVQLYLRLRAFFVCCLNSYLILVGVFSHLVDWWLLTSPGCVFVSVSCVGYVPDLIFQIVFDPYYE